MKKNIISVICLISFDIFTQNINDTNSIKLNFIDNLEYKDQFNFNKILNSKIKECSCEALFFNIGYISMLDYNKDIKIKSLNDQIELFLKEKETIITSKIKYRFVIKGINDTFDKVNSIYKIIGVVRDSFFIRDNPKNDTIFDRDINSKGFNMNLLHKISYSSIFNKLWYQLGLINESTYYKRFKCIDFKKLHKKLSKKYLRNK